MLVQGTSSTRTTGARSVKRTRGGAGFRLGLDSVGGGPAVATAGGIASLASLLALQDVDGTDEAQARAGIDHGADLLDRLGDLQADLLDGRLDRAALADLADIAGRGAPRGADPRLARILQDIEVRAAVELAKLDIDLPAAPTPSPPLTAQAMGQATVPATRASCLRAYRDPTVG